VHTFSLLLADTRCPIGTTRVVAALFSTNSAAGATTHSTFRQPTGLPAASAKRVCCVQVWDNNNHQDFHTAVTVKRDKTTMIEETYKRLLNESMQKDADGAHRAGALPLGTCVCFARDATLACCISILASLFQWFSNSLDVFASRQQLLRAAIKAGERVKLRAEAAAKRRAAQRRVLYTQPLKPQAGKPCEVFYNPDHTALSGRPDVYVRGSWNRWNHPDIIPTTKMEPAFPGGIGWLKVLASTPGSAQKVVTRPFGIGSYFCDCIQEQFTPEEGCWQARFWSCAGDCASAARCADCRLCLFGL
jgi:hypothetical protein